MSALSFMDTKPALCSSHIELVLRQSDVLFLVIVQMLEKLVEMSDDGFNFTGLMERGQRLMTAVHRAEEKQSRTH